MALLVWRTTTLGIIVMHILGHGHSYNSERSSIVQMIVFLILAGDQDQWTGQLLADTALLLTSDTQGRP